MLTLQKEAEHEIYAEYADQFGYQIITITFRDYDKINNAILAYQIVTILILPDHIMLVIDNDAISESRDITDKWEETEFEWLVGSDENLKEIYELFVKNLS